MRSVVGERGKVTIPMALRERLGIYPRTVLEFQEENGRLIIEKASSVDIVARVTGCLKLKEGTDKALRRLRGPV